MRTMFIIIVLALATLNSATLSAASQDAAPPARQQHRRTLSPRGEILQKLLYSRLSVDFDETRAQDAFNFVRNALDINMLVRYLDSVHGSGIDPDAPISLRFKDVPAIDLIEMMLDQVADIEACTWQVRSSFLEIGTKYRLSEEGAQELKVYPVADILFEPVDFTDAPSLNLEDQLAGGVIWGTPYLYGDQRGRYPGGYEPHLYGNRRLTSGGFSSYSTGGGELRSTSNEPARAAALISLITEMIEPEQWRRNGGTGATIAFRDGALIVRAPDYIHRQLAGYPAVPPIE